MAKGQNEGLELHKHPLSLRHTPPLGPITPILGRVTMHFSSKAW